MGGKAKNISKNMPEHRHSYLIEYINYIPYRLSFLPDVRRIQPIKLPIIRYFRTFSSLKTENNGDKWPYLCNMENASTYYAQKRVFILR